MLALFQGLAKEIPGEAVEGYVISGEVVGHGQVHVGRVELEVDLAVDRGLGVRVEVLAHPGRPSAVPGGGSRGQRASGEGWPGTPGTPGAGGGPALRGREAAWSGAQGQQRRAHVLGEEPETGQHARPDGSGETEARRAQRGLVRARQV